MFSPTQSESRYGVCSRNERRLGPAWRSSSGARVSAPPRARAAAAKRDGGAATPREEADAVEVDAIQFQVAEDPAHAFDVVVAPARRAVDEERLVLEREVGAAAARPFTECVHHAAA